MKTNDAFCLAMLGMLWGMSFLFIRQAVPEFGALALIEVRVALAAVALAPIVIARGQVTAMLANWRAIAVMGVLHYAIPFSLYAYAMLTLSAGYSSIINAAAPIFTGIITYSWLGERHGTSRVAGLLLGLVGVVVLVWEKLAVGGGPDALAVLATIGAAFCYGLAAVLAKRQLAGVNSLAVAGGSMSFAAVVLLPFAIWFWPATSPTPGAWSMAAALGIICTALAFVLYFRLIASAGAVNSITVTFLIPVFAVAFGVLLLQETVSATMIAGGAIVALGTALATGFIDLGTLIRRARPGRFRTVTDHRRNSPTSP